MDDVGSNSCFGSPFRGLWTLSCDFTHHNELGIKMDLVAAHLNAGLILVAMV